MLDDTLFLKTLGYIFWVFSKLKFVHDFHANEVFGLDLNGQLATTRVTVITKFGCILYPGFWFVE